MFTRFRHRSYRLEHIDIGDYTAEEYEGCITELQLVNKWMGDAWALRKTFFREVRESGLRSFSVLDVAAGSGELLRVTGRWARQNAKSLLAVGLELNERSARAIAEESAAFPSIGATRGDALNLPFADKSFDYVISSLFTHHLTDEQIPRVLAEMSRVAARRVFVIDLHRHPISYLLYTTVAKVVLHQRLIREDGALSILRSFKPSELERFALVAGLRDVSVRRHFPFRLVLSASGSSAAATTRDSSAESIDRAA